MQASFSWDWGPAFPSVGAWKPVYIRSYNQAVIQDVAVNVFENPIDEIWNVNCTVYFKSSAAANQNISGIVTAKLSTDLNEVNIFTDINGKINEMGEYMANISLTVPKVIIRFICLL